MCPLNITTSHPAVTFSASADALRLELTNATCTGGRSTGRTGNLRVVAPSDTSLATPPTVTAADGSQTTADHGPSGAVARSAPTGFGSYGSPMGWLGVAVGLFGATVLALHALSVHLPGCVVRATTGIPCPGCGFTHLGIELAAGRFATALATDPAAVAFTVLLGALAVTQLVAMARRNRGPRWIASPVTAVAVGGLFAAHWVTTIVTGGMLTV